MAELAATAVVELVSNLTSKHKQILISVTPTATNDVITFDQSTSGVVVKAGGGFEKIVTAWAIDGSTGMPKAISGNGSTILTTVGWENSDNKWFIWVIARNESGEVIR